MLEKVYIAMKELVQVRFQKEKWRALEKASVFSEISK